MQKNFTSGFFLRLSLACMVTGLSDSFPIHFAKRVLFLWDEPN
jgi:hypothetical protein